MNNLVTDRETPDHHWGFLKLLEYRAVENPLSPGAVDIHVDNLVTDRESPDAYWDRVGLPKDEAVDRSCCGTMAPPMRYAVFLRNVNLGRPNAPTREQFEAAFLRAGAREAASFLTNGTLVYAPGDGVTAQAVFEGAYRTLQSVCGLREPAFVRTVDYLAALVALDPFAGIDRGSVYAFCVSFLLDPSVTPPTLPLASARRDVELIRVTPGEVLSVSRQVMKAPGSPNAFLEKHLGSQLSTREWNTITRLVKRFG